MHSTPASSLQCTVRCKVVAIPPMFCMETTQTGNWQDRPHLMLLAASIRMNLFQIMQEAKLHPFNCSLTWHRTLIDFWFSKSAKICSLFNGWKGEAWVNYCVSTRSPQCHHQKFTQTRALSLLMIWTTFNFCINGMAKGQITNF